MENKTHKKIDPRLIAGDLVVLLLVTLYGFASHNTLATAGTRLLTTFIPLVVGWALVGPHLGVYDPARSTDPRQLWRPFWGMLLAAPLAVWLRGVLLGMQPILPLLVIVLGGVSALGLLAWRSLYVFILARRRGLSPAAGG